MAGLSRFLVRRALTFIPTVVGATFIVFLVAAVIPANPARLWAGGEKANPQVVEQLVREYHLKDPIIVQYYFFMEKLLTNSMVSPVTHNKVWEDVFRYFPVTFQLAILAFVMVLAIGIPLGIISALKRDTWVDTTIRIIALIGVSTPIFWLAYLLIFVFFTELKLITLAGTPTPPYSITGIPLIDAIIMLDGKTLSQILARYTLPAFVLAYPSIGVVARLVRNSFLDAMGSDFVEYIEARGLPRSWKYRHVLRNAMVPIVTVLGLMFGGLLAGAPITETVFGLPGLGRYMLQAINNYDYLSLIGALFLVSLIYVIANLVVDILYAVIDPRVRY
ncbi:MAG: ABC transporter permease [Pyrodictiaceae archaeon]